MLSLSGEYRYTDMGSRHFSMSDFSFCTDLSNEGIPVPTADGLGPACPLNRPHVEPAETEVSANDHQFTLRLNVRVGSLFP
jgi:hypothetical protein